MTAHDPYHAQQVSYAPSERVVESLRQVTTAVAGADGIDQILATVLNACCDGLGYPFASLSHLEVTGDELTGRLILAPATCAGLRDCVAMAELAPQEICYRLDPPENLLVRVFNDAQPRIVPYSDQLLPLIVPPPLMEPVQQVLRLSSIALLPLPVRGHCAGVLTVAASDDCPLTEYALPALEILAGQAGQALESARIRRDLLDRERQVSYLLGAIIAAQEDERERICLEIHDGVAQTLAPAFHYLQVLDGQIDEHTRLHDEHTEHDHQALHANVNLAAKLVRSAIREAREVITSLRRPARRAWLDTHAAVRDGRVPCADRYAGRVHRRAVTTAQDHGNGDLSHHTRSGQ